MLQDKIKRVMISVIIVLVLVFGVWNWILFEQVIEKEECIDVNRVAGFVYDMCYDSYTKEIIVLAKRESGDYKLNSFEISFFDVKERHYNLEYDFINDSQLYRFYAEINPKTIDLILNVEKNFSKPICDNPYTLFVRDCLTKLPGRVVDSLGEKEILLEDIQKEKNIDFINFNKKESFWKIQCESDWNCSEWENCDGEVQKRICEDISKCVISTDSPKTVRYCGDKCIENWDCKWSECVDGFTTPTCEDMNNCNTSFILPPIVSCFFEGECTPFIQCDRWSDCEIDYTFFDLSEEGINEIRGVKSRICKDLNFCVESIRETRGCSTGVDIYTQRFVEDDRTFIDIYNSLNNELIATVEEGAKENPYLNIYFDNQGSDNNYCFNGKMDGNEEGVDCGGSCGECVGNYEQIFLNEKTWWESFGDWIRKILS